VHIFQWIIIDFIRKIVLIFGAGSGGRQVKVISSTAGCVLCLHYVTVNSSLTVHRSQRNLKPIKKWLILSIVSEFPRISVHSGKDLDCQLFPPHYSFVNLVGCFDKACDFSHTMVWIWWPHPSRSHWSMPYLNAALLCSTSYRLV
jgi:hypothetical protein